MGIINLRYNGIYLLDKSKNDRWKGAIDGYRWFMMEAMPKPLADRLTVGW